MDGKPGSFFVAHLFDHDALRDPLQRSRLRCQNLPVLLLSSRCAEGGSSRTHDVRFVFERGIVVHRDAAGIHCACDAPLRLLHDMPRLMREMPLLPGGQMDLAALRERVCVQLRRAR